MYSVRIERMFKIEIIVASASNVSGVVRTWPSLEQVHDLHPQTPMDHDHLTTTRTLETSKPEEENARSAVLL